MCGIIGFIGNKNCYQYLILGLKLLQNRGYDSAGVSVISENIIHTLKYASTNELDSIKNLERNNGKLPEATFGIAHTRWATHGSKTDENAHTHLSMDETISVVHNGIIDNYLELKDFLMKKGYKFCSQTDTEVISQMLQYFLDEYNNDLGSKQTEAYNMLDKNSTVIKPGLWRRDYTNGIVVVNSTDKEQRYVFAKEEFDRIRGVQDFLVNNGQKVNWLNLAPRDGIVLLKRPTIIRDSWFINGNFFRIFNNQGSQLRNGFFAYVDNYQGSQPILFHNFSGNGEEQIISVLKGNLNITTNGKRTLSFKPYGAFNGIFGVAAANVGGDEKEEIITGAGFGGGPQVRVFDINGKVRSSFMAYDKNFRGGVNIAAGNVIGDSKAEIITGAGFGGGPHVRVFDNNGQSKVSFMAYDKNFRGGVNVAVGDVDGDGQNEIVTGAGRGGGPQVRIFNGLGQIKASFMAYDENYREGIFIAVYDINNDGVAEILTGISGF